MAMMKIGKSHGARKELFQKGIRQGFLTAGDIEKALPPGAMTDAERWLLYYSLRAANVEIRDEAAEAIGERVEETKEAIESPERAEESAAEAARPQPEQ